jgi:hypothetical protein
MLPKGKLSTRKVELSGGTVEVHSLTLSQSRIAGNLEGEARIVAAISFATGLDKADVQEWLEDAPAGDATKLLNAITDVSGLSAEAQFPERP